VETQLQDTRLWIFQSNRDLTSDEISYIDLNLPLFLNNWAAHGNPLTARYFIDYNRFLIIQVDESIFEASGCSIDKLTRFIESLEDKFTINLRDRLSMAVLNVEKDKTKTIHINSIKEEYIKGNLTDDSIVFVNNLSKGSELKEQWKVPFRNSGFYNFIK
jgi:hypothetical protein